MTFPVPQYRETWQPENFVGRLARLDVFNTPYMDMDGGRGGIPTLGQVGPGPSGSFHVFSPTITAIAGVATGQLFQAPLQTTGP